jgi:hypothetical protein
MKPIGLTDSQLLTIQRAAGPLHPQDRGPSMMSSMPLADQGRESRLRIPEHQIENEGEQHDETEHDYGLDVHVNNWWQVISITVANYGSASCAVCTVADRQTGQWQTHQ